MYIYNDFRAPQKIEDDLKLKEFLDDAKDGVIYVSFGSVVKAKYMDEDKRKAFLNVFRKLKQKVLWKWETEHMDGDMLVSLRLSEFLCSFTFLHY